MDVIFVPVILHEARNFNVQHYTDDPDRVEPDSNIALAPLPRPLVTTTILPGLNYVPAARLKAARLDPDSSNVRLTIEDPTKLPKFAKVDLAKKTTSRIALTRWRTKETDADAIAAIDAGLARKTG